MCFWQVFWPEFCATLVAAVIVIFLTWKIHSCLKVHDDNRVYLELLTYEILLNMVRTNRLVLFADQYLTETENIYVPIAFKLKKNVINCILQADTLKSMHFIGAKKDNTTRFMILQYREQIDRVEMLFDQNHHYNIFHEGLSNRRENSLEYLTKAMIYFENIFLRIVSMYQNYLDNELNNLHNILNRYEIIYLYKSSEFTETTIPNNKYIICWINDRNLTGNIILLSGLRAISGLTVGD